ncbi:hypothetical protein ACS0TY_020173 [Phlomoides rotata]
MEAARAEVDGDVDIATGTSYTHAVPALPAQTEHFDSPKICPIPASSAKRKVKSSTQDPQPQVKDTPPSVSNCYVFKSRLQEYCQKAGITSPVYETIKEGPSHEPSFRSTVILNNVRYDSLPGFFNRKAAEQSAAEVALVELAKSSDMNSGITQPVHETGLCKNLLQEYAQKMNYAIPCYEIRKDEKEGRTPMYSCTVDIGGIKYIGASASTKKEAEKKAARTALLAIQTAGPVNEDQAGNSIYTVIPQKKKVPDPIISTQETKAAHKPKKGRFKKYLDKKRANRTDNSTGDRLGVTDAVSLESDNMNRQGGVDGSTIDTVGSQGKTNGGPDICTEGQKLESSAANIIAPHGIGSGYTETVTASSTYNGNTEIARVPVDGCNDGGSTIMNVD